MLAVMCCSCFSVLARDGSLIHIGARGLLNIGAILQGNESVAQFADKRAADDCAAGFGWSVQDAIGPNHRCPRCRLLADSAERGRGAYIEMESGSIPMFNCTCESDVLGRCVVHPGSGARG
jgi:hypothetical protein